MSYAAKQDLIDRFSLVELIQLTDLGDPPAGEVDDDMVNDALADADGEINGYLASRVSTPLAAVPRIIVQWACAIARYRLAKDHATERMRADYQDAVAWLKQYALGNASLGDSSDATAPSSAGTPKMQADERIFTRDKLKGF